MTDLDLEDGLTALEELEWELDGLNLSDADPIAIVAEQSDEGFDDVGEIDEDDQQGNLDGSYPGEQRIISREVALYLSVSRQDSDLDTSASTLADALDDLRVRISPLPDRSALRILRYRRRGEVAKRLYVRPARGRPLSVASNEDRLIYSSADLVVRLNAPDPTIYSDVAHREVFTAGQTKTIVNAGSLCARLIPWSVEADATVTISIDDFDEEITFAVPSGESLSVNRPPGTLTPEIATDTTYGICHGPSNATFPQWPLLRPGENAITASAACTFTWRDTW